ncbi:hypothetical protein SCACP_28000 [Sporomusa carbonis]|uniref:anti-sigma factor family protein n=1 Tax=Sporomusa carbonis TaxID=3076075 RepID=UPI003A6BF231
MNCKECRELFFDYCDDELDISLKEQVTEHIKTCASCQNELAAMSSTMSFFKENMPVITVDTRFTEQVMQKIASAETAIAFTKPMVSIGVILAILTLGMLALIGPAVISLLLLAGNILLGLLSTATVVFSTFPLIQITGSVLLVVLLFLVTFSMRRMVLLDLV